MRLTLDLSVHRARISHLVCAAVAALLLAFVAAPADARPKPKKPTEVTAAVNNPTVSAEVQAVSACRKRRTVKLLEVMGEERVVVETAKTDAAGAVMFSEFALPFNEYQVVAPRKATRRVVCKPGRSAVVSGTPIR